MRSELENTLLALLALHPHASGYELHRVIEDSTGHLLSASFSQIYPALIRESRVQRLEWLRAFRVEAQEGL